MARKEKLLSRIQNNPHQVRFEDIDKVMRQAGFGERHSGSHYVYSHPQIPGVVTIVRPHGKGGTQFVAPIYIKKALAAIDQIEELEL
ncbi:type II toxin-antitoxin system HicA family toxin [candidate division KSB1 bacterium]|nr:type II toxin-antitoxin system HicA family toxin [candidate division KSB1 bacterium]